SVLSTVSLPTPACGGAAGPCPAAADESQFALLGSATTTLLAQVEPRTLRPLPGRFVPLGGPAGAYAQSPDGSQLAVAPARGGRLRLIGLPELRPVRALVFPQPRTLIRALAWVAP